MKKEIVKFERAREQEIRREENTRGEKEITGGDDEKRGRRENRIRYLNMYSNACGWIIGESFYLFVPGN